MTRRSDRRRCGGLHHQLPGGRIGSGQQRRGNGRIAAAHHRRDRRRRDRCRRLRPLPCRRRARHGDVDNRDLCDLRRPDDFVHRPARDQRIADPHPVDPVGSQRRRQTLPGRRVGRHGILSASWRRLERNLLCRRPLRLLVPASACLFERTMPGSLPGHDGAGYKAQDNRPRRAEPCPFSQRKGDQHHDDCCESPAQCAVHSASPVRPLRLLPAAKARSVPSEIPATFPHIPVDASEFLPACRNALRGDGWRSATAKCGVRFLVARGRFIATS